MSMYTAQKMKFSIKDSFCKCDQMRRNHTSGTCASLTSYNAKMTQKLLIWRYFINLLSLGSFWNLASKALVNVSCSSRILTFQKKLFYLAQMKVRYKSWKTVFISYDRNNFFRSQGTSTFIFTFWSCRKLEAWLER